MDSNNPQNTTLNISTFSILKIIFIILGLGFLYYIQEIVAIVFISMIFAMALNPIVNKLKSWKIPRAIGILLIYVALLLTVGLSITLLIQPITEQVQGLSKAFPDLLKKLPVDPQELNKLTSLNFFKQNGLLTLSHTQKIYEALLDILGGIFGGLMFFFIVLVLIYYIIIEKDILSDMVISIIPHEHRKRTLELAHRVQAKLNAWLGGQLMLCLIIGLLSYIGLLLAGVDYALVLALFAGITEFIPYVGPYLGAIPAILLAYTTASPTGAMFIAGWFLMIQRLENDIIVPKVMQKAVGIDPVISIVGMLIGAKVGGITGVMLTIPVAAALTEVMKDYLEHRDNK